VATPGQRLAQLERREPGDQGASVCGFRRVYHDTGTGPDVVAVQATGEALTVAAFGRRYPRGLIVQRLEFHQPTGDDAA